MMLTQVLAIVKESLGPCRRGGYRTREPLTLSSTQLQPLEPIDRHTAIGALLKGARFREPVFRDFQLDIEQFHEGIQDAFDDVVSCREAARFRESTKPLSDLVRQAAHHGGSRIGEGRFSRFGSA
jgi:hypothetical protein